MQSYDLFMLAVVAAAVVWGAWKGLAWQLASVGSIVLSYFVSVNFRGPVSKLFNYQPPEWNSFLAMLVLYVGSSMVIWVAFNLIRDMLEKMQLKEFDRQIGGLVGLAKGVLICTIITLFTMGLGTESQRQAVITSRSGYYMARLIEKVEPLMPAEYRPRLEQAIALLENRNGVAPGSYQSGQQSPFSWLFQNKQATNNWTGQNNGWGGSNNSGGWGQQNSSGGGLFSQQNLDRFGQEVQREFQQGVQREYQQQILPRIEQEQARVQSEIDRYQQGFPGR